MPSIAVLLLVLVKIRLALIVERVRDSWVFTMQMAGYNLMLGF